VIEFLGCFGHNRAIGAHRGQLVSSLQSMSHDIDFSEEGAAIAGDVLLTIENDRVLNIVVSARPHKGVIELFQRMVIVKRNILLNDVVSYLIINQISLSYIRGTVDGDDHRMI